MCPLNRTSPPPGFQHGETKSASCLEKLWFYLWTLHWHMMGGSLWPLQLYFVLNECVIRRPGPLHERFTQRNAEREQWTVLNLTYTGTLWPVSVKAVLFLENKLTITLAFNTGWSEKLKLMTILCLSLLSLHFSWCYWQFSFPVIDLPGVSYSGRTFCVGLFDEPYGSHMSLPEGCHFPSGTSSLASGGIKLDHPWISRAHISELWCWDLAN